MANKQDVFEKIGILLQELNDQYTSLSTSGTVDKEVELALFEASSNYLSAHIAVFNKTVQAEKPAAKLESLYNIEEVFPEEIKTSNFAESEKPKVQFAEYFTPPSQHIDNKATVTTQPEISEHQVEETQVLDNTTVEEKPEAQIEKPEVQIEKPEVQIEKPEAQVEKPEAQNEKREAQIEKPEAQNEKPEAQVEKPEAQNEKPVAQNETIEAEKQEVIQEEKVVIIEEKVAEPSRPLSLNEILSQQRKANAVNQTQQQPEAAEKIADIKTAVSLNDKLIFIKDLFNGYSLGYSEAIEILNRYSDFAEADAFLQTNYALKNNWADKPATVEKFYAILRKRF